MIRTLIEVVAATWRAFRRINGPLTPYPMGTPHLPKDVASWPEDAIRASSIGPDTVSTPEEKEVVQAGKIAYSFIDRGVSRAQGLLQFNSIVFAAVIFTLTDPTALSIPLTGISLLATLSLGVSTLLCLACLWIIWYRPEDHRNPATDALYTWQVWLDRSLLFNVALVLATISFLGIFLIIVITLFDSLSTSVLLNVKQCPTPLDVIDGCVGNRRTAGRL